MSREEEEGDKEKCCVIDRNVLIMCKLPKNVSRNSGIANKFHLSGFLTEPLPPHNNNSHAMVNSMPKKDTIKPSNPQQFPPPLRILLDIFNSVVNRVSYRNKCKKTTPIKTSCPKFLPLTYIRSLSSTKLLPMHGRWSFYAMMRRSPSLLLLGRRPHGKTNRKIQFVVRRQSEAWAMEDTLHREEAHRVRSS